MKRICENLDYYSKEKLNKDGKKGIETIPENKKDNQR